MKESKVSEGLTNSFNVSKERRLMVSDVVLVLLNI